MPPPPPPRSPATTASDETPVEATEAFSPPSGRATAPGSSAGSPPRPTRAPGQTEAEAVAECQNDASAAEALGAATFGAITPVSEDADEATVSVVVTLGGEPAERRFVLRRVEGEWRFDLSSMTTRGG